MVAKGFRRLDICCSGKPFCSTAKVKGGGFLTHQRIFGVPAPSRTLVSHKWIPPSEGTSKAVELHPKTHRNGTTRGRLSCWDSHAVNRLAQGCFRSLPSVPGLMSPNVSLLIRTPKHVEIPFSNAFLALFLGRGGVGGGRAAQKKAAVRVEDVSRSDQRTSQGRGTRGCTSTEEKTHIRTT